jgi:hypothetical protein
VSVIPMPKFFLHLTLPHSSTVKDLHGEDFPDLKAACHAALLNARCLMADEIAQGQLPELGSYYVADFTGKVVAEVTFREAIEAT